MVYSCMAPGPWMIQAKQYCLRGFMGPREAVWFWIGLFASNKPSLMFLSPCHIQELDSTRKCNFSHKKSERLFKIPKHHNTWKFKICIIYTPGLSSWHGSKEKESACQCRRPKRYRLDPWVGKIPWKRKWQPTAVFLSGKPYGGRSLAGYTPWGHRVRHDWAHMHTHPTLNWFRILDLWVIAENQKMSGSGSDMRPVSLLLCTCERAGLHQCFPGCGMRQVNEIFLDGLALTWKNVDSQSRHAPRLGFQNMGCFILVVIMYVNDIC